MIHLIWRFYFIQTGGSLIGHYNPDAKGFELYTGTRPGRYMKIFWRFYFKTQGFGGFSK